MQGENIMSLLKSIFYNMKEANFNPIKLSHGFSYTATVTYLRVLKYLVRINSRWFRNHISETYHSKVIRLNDANKIININRNIDIRNLDQIIPYKQGQPILFYRQLALVT